jgi:hypothetical protein
MSVPAIVSTKATAARDTVVVIACAEGDHYAWKFMKRAVLGMRAVEVPLIP